jgi:hypothetical protein
MCTARARPTATRGATRVHGAGAARVRIACAAHGYEGRGPARPRPAERARRRTVVQHVTVARHALLRRRPHRRTGDDREGVAGLTGAWTVVRHDSA